MFRQQANLVAKKREQVVGRLEAVARDRAIVESELSSKVSALYNINIYIHIFIYIYPGCQEARAGGGEA